MIGKGFFSLLILSIIFDAAIVTPNSVFFPFVSRKVANTFQVSSTTSLLAATNSIVEKKITPTLGIFDRVPLRQLFQSLQHVMC